MLYCLYIKIFSKINHTYRRTNHFVYGLWSMVYGLSTIDY